MSNPRSSSDAELVAGLVEVLRAETAEGAIPLHGRHPNYNILMRMDIQRSPTGRGGGSGDQLQATVAPYHASNNLWKRPFVYYFTGKKWPKTIFCRALCECAKHVTEDQAVSCQRFEVAGTPVIVERYTFGDAAAVMKHVGDRGMPCATLQQLTTHTLCRMFCSRIHGSDARRGDCIRHLRGMSSSDVRTLFVGSTQPLIRPEEGVRDRSWQQFTCSLQWGSSVAMEASECEDSSNDAASIRRPCTTSSVCETSSSCGLSVGSTPAASVCSELLEVTGLTTSPSPRVTLEDHASTTSPESAQSSSRHPTQQQHAVKSSATQCIHNMFAQDMLERERTYRALRLSPAAALPLLLQPCRDTSVTDAWQALRLGEVATIDRRAVVSSIDEIMTANRCSRAAFYGCVSILDSYVVRWAAAIRPDSKGCMSGEAPGRTNIAGAPFPAATSQAIRSAIACAISVASKHYDIFPVSLSSLTKSLGKDVTQMPPPLHTFERLEMHFLTQLQFRINAVTLDEVVGSLLELQEPMASTKQQQQLASLTPTDELSSSIQKSSSSMATHPHETEGTSIRSRRCALMKRLCEYLCDILIRSTAATSLSVCHLGAAVFHYAHEVVPSSSSPSLVMDAADTRPSDGLTLNAFMGQLDPQLLSQCSDIIRQCHEHALVKQNPFLERRYGQQQPQSQPQNKSEGSERHHTWLPISITQFALPLAPAVTQSSLQVEEPL